MQVNSLVPLLFNNAAQEHNFLSAKVEQVNSLYQKALQSLRAYKQRDAKVAELVKIINSQRQSTLLAFAHQYS